MLFRPIVAVLTLTAALTGPTFGVAGGGGEQTGRYYTSATPGVSVVCCNNEAISGTIEGGFGGYQFPAFDGIPRELHIADDVTGSAGIGWTVCQTVEEGGPEQSCGDAGTISIGGCTGDDGKVDLRGFGYIANESVAVFIRMADTDCEGNAVTGVLTMRYS